MLGICLQRTAYYLYMAKKVVETKEDILRQIMTKQDLQDAVQDVKDEIRLLASTFQNHEQRITKLEERAHS